MPNVDPEALRTYQRTVQAQLDKLEDEIISQLRNGQPLGKLPAFGMLDGSEAARTTYQTFHETTWNNLQALRESLDGIVTTLDEAAKGHEDSDDVSGQNFDAQL
ncbi:hypothetical protein SAMN05216298_3388 [Glycomyces sambucus]|uniref:PE family protein n=1 Tax=Glycomyces sambucus TaxID=380244 RepID=A0A1G9J349_9ACTN|nr:hypothetical protein [Glycomyces sambucus]SDL31869.1 hypothetical protein SAMN05216298_3388 [Glycomyces sambucus]